MCTKGLLLITIVLVFIQNTCLGEIQGTACDGVGVDGIKSTAGVEITSPTCFIIYLSSFKITGSDLPPLITNALESCAKWDGELDGVTGDNGVILKGAHKPAPYTFTYFSKNSYFKISPAVSRQDTSLIIEKER